MASNDTPTAIEKFFQTQCRQNAPVGTPTPDMSPYDLPLAPALNVRGAASIAYDSANHQLVLDVIGGAAPTYVVDLFNYAPIGARQILLLDGYGNSQDGGGGQFYWDSAYVGAGDDVTIIVPSYVGHTTGAWMRQWDHARIDVRWAGAEPDIFTDANTARYEVALAACGGVYVLYFPKFGTYWYVTYPLAISNSNQVIEGIPSSTLGSLDGTNIRGAGSTCFALFWVGSPTSFLSGGTPTYVSRGGFDWLVMSEASGPNQPTVTYSQYPHVSLHGRKHLCVEAMVHVTGAPTGGNTNIFASYGKKTYRSPATSAIWLKYVDLGSGNYGVTCHITTDGGSGSVTTHRTSSTPPTWEYDVSTTGTQFTGGTDAKVAASFDGTTIRIFVNGVLQASQAVDNPTTEGIRKNWWENVNLGTVYSQAYNGDLLFNPPNAQVTGVRISRAARYTTGSPYAVETSPLTSDSDTLMLHTFAPADRVKNFILGHTGIGTGDVYYEYLTNLAQGAAGITFRSLSLSNPLGYTLAMHGSPNWHIERVSHSAMNCVDIHNNCYTGAIRDCWAQATIPGGLGGFFEFDDVSSWGAALMQRDICGLAEVHGFQIRASWQWCFVAVNQCDTDYFRCYNLSGGQGNYYFGASRVKLNGEFPTDEGGVVKTCTLLSNRSNVRVDDGELQNATGAAYGACIVLVDSGQQQRFDTNYNGLNVPVFAFVGDPPEQPLVAEGPNSNDTFSTPLDMVDTTRPGLIVRPSSQAGGVATIDFPADANLTLTDNQWTRTGAIRFTDVLHPLSATRDVTPPYLSVDGYVHTIFNDGALRTLRIGGATGVSIAAGASARVGSKGGKIVAWP